MRIIVISPEDSVPNEISLVQKMMEIDPEMRFHIRKPDWALAKCRDYLTQMEPKFLPRISIHQHHELSRDFSEIGIHLKEENRKGNAGRSTSFHSSIVMNELQNNFDYFFCSPVFPSISKKGYSPKEDWDINRYSDQVREKAVALGGMTAQNISKAKKNGFGNYAFLGSIWLSENPIETFNEIIKHAY